MASRFRDRLRDRRQGQAAYTLVDLSELDEDLRKDILLDANEGGGTYGIRVVEESVNGAARAPIYGVYKDGPDAERWSTAKEELGLSGSEVDDSEIYSSSGIEVDDARREAALREAAAQEASATADRIRSGEQAAISEIIGEEVDATRQTSTGRPTGTDHPQNIVDPTLNKDATNKASDPDAAAAAADAAKKSANKAPK